MQLVCVSYSVYFAIRNFKDIRRWEWVLKRSFSSDKQIDWTRVRKIGNFQKASVWNWQQNVLIYWMIWKTQTIFYAPKRQWLAAVFPRSRTKLEHIVTLQRVTCKTLKITQYILKCFLTFYVSLTRQTATQEISLLIWPWKGDDCSGFAPVF